MMIVKLAALTVPLVVASALLTSAAYSHSPPPAQPASSAGAPASAPPGASAQALTAAELVTVKKILAPYQPASITADDAKLIKRTLRDSGLPRNAALDVALNAAGFSPAKLDQLDPPPPRPADSGTPTQPKR